MSAWSWLTGKSGASRSGSVSRDRAHDAAIPDTDRPQRRAARRAVGNLHPARPTDRRPRQARGTSHQTGNWKGSNMNISAGLIAFLLRLATDAPHLVQEGPQLYAD